MPFPENERAALRAVPYVGDTLILRLEQAGLHSLADLAGQDARALCADIAARMGATCWSNSPQARRAIDNAIACAIAHAAAARAD